MKNELEITVKVDMRLNDLLNYLNEGAFTFHSSFRCNDIYLIKKEDIAYPFLAEYLNKCIILRELIFKEKVMKYVMYRYKNIADNGNVISTKTKKIPIKNTYAKMQYFLENGYVVLAKMNDYCYTFSKKGHEFIVEHIPLVGTFIEVEQKGYYSDVKNGESVEDLIELLDSFKIPYDKSSYYQKKIMYLINKEEF